VLRDRLKLPAGDGGALAARLLTPLTLVHIENADTVEAGQIVGELSDSLPGCALIFSARLRGLGADAGWREVLISPFDTATALDQLRAELGDAAPGRRAGLLSPRRSAACRWHCTWPPGISAGTTGPSHSSGACEPSIWR